MTVPEAPEARTSLLAGPYRALTIGIVALMSLAAFEYLAVATAMPTVARALDGLTLYPLAFGGSLAAGVVGMVVAGGWSDGKGPAGPIWAGVALFVVGLVVAGLAPAMWLLVLGRVVQGFGSGLMTVALYVVVARVYPAELRPRIFAAFAGAWVVPSIVGPAIAGLIVERLGWRWVFLAVPLLAVPAAGLLRSRLGGLGAPVGERGGDASTSARRTLWAVGAALGVGVLYVGGQARGLGGVALMGLGLVGIALFAPRLLPAGTPRAGRGLPATVALRALAGAAFVATEAFLPLMLSRERGLSPAAAGTALTVSALAWVVGSWWRARPRQRLSPPRLLRLGMALIAVGIGVVALTLAPAVPVPLGIAGWSLAGLGMGIVFPTLSVLTLELSPPAAQGTNSSALQLGDSLFSATVLALGGSLFAALLARSAPAAYLASYAIGGGLALLGVWVAGRTAPGEAAVGPVERGETAGAAAAAEPGPRMASSGQHTAAWR